MEMVGTRKRGGIGEDESASKVANVNADSVDGNDVVQGSTAGGSEEVQASVAAVVTPAKASQASVKPRLRFYMMNTLTCKSEMFGSFVAAKVCKDILVKHYPKLEDHLSIHEFETNEEAETYLRAFYSLGNREVESEQDDGKDDKKAPAAVNAAAAKADAAELPDDPIMDSDDDVPFEPVLNDGARSASTETPQSPQMSAFAAATIGGGTSIVIYRWRLPGSKYHVYAYKLMDGQEQYWSHKPHMWMLAVQTEKDAPIFAPPETLTLHKAMNRNNAAGIRAVPCGDSTIQTVKTKKTGKIIEQYCFYGFVHESKTNDDIRELIKSFVRHCSRNEIRTAYFLTLKERMQSSYISEDTKATGKYWIKLASGANNMVISERKYLSEVFLDADIETIINLAYKTPGESPSNWPAYVRTAAFGTSSSG
jgi:hypothetical protein